MLTPQDIAEKGFDKAVFNGYDMGGVDNFLETVSNDYNALYKENAILKGKLKVLVEKVEEYRSTEDAMRMALLTAQRMGEEITVEAKRAREEMLQNTEVEIKAKLTDIAQRVTEEETRLAIATKETTKFIELSQAIMNKHSEFLTKLETAHRAVKSKSGAKQAVPEQSAQAKAQRAAKASQAAHAAQEAQAGIFACSKCGGPVKENSKFCEKCGHSASQQPIQQVQQTQQIPQVQPVPAQGFEIDDIASQIGSVVESLTDDEPAAPAASTAPEPEEPHPSLFEDDDGAVKLYSPDEEDEPEADISPRPKFDFDDLKFGANFDSDD